MIDLEFGSSTITSVLGLGFKDHSAEGAGLDPSDRDDAIAIAPHPVFGMYQPGGLATAEIDGETYLFTANEDDARDYDAFSEEERVKDLTLDATLFPNAADLQENEQLGRLQVTTALGDPDGDGDYDALYAFGTRSLSVHRADGTRIWDPGDGIERQIEALIADGDLPQEAFGSDNDDNNSFDNRSDARGPEPSHVVTGRVDGVPYVFVGLERISAVLAYDVSDPAAPSYAGFLQNRDYTVPAELDGGGANPAAGDLGLAGLAFVPRDASPTGRALLVVSNDVSGTVTLYGLGTGGSSTPDGPDAAWLRLHGAAPNPGLAPSLAFDLDRPADVRVAVFDALGRKLVRVDRRFAAGEDLRLQPDVSELAAGVYLYTVEARVGAKSVRRSGRFVLAR